MNGTQNVPIGIQVGDVRGNGIVIGHGSSASVSQSKSSVESEAAVLLDDFIKLLGSYEVSIADVASVRESVAAAADEMSSPSPRWQVVRGLLRGIAPSIAGLSSLTEALTTFRR